MLQAENRSVCFDNYEPQKRMRYNVVQEQPIAARFRMAPDQAL